MLVVVGSMATIVESGFCGTKTDQLELVPLADRNRQQ